MSARQTALPKTPEGFDYSTKGKEALDEEIQRYESALLDIWAARTRLNGSQVLDEPECRRSAKFLLQNPPHTPWKTWIRIISNIGHAIGGVLIGYALTDQQVSGAKATAIVLGGAIIIVLTAVVQELVLREKHQ